MAISSNNITEDAVSKKIYQQCKEYAESNLEKNYVHNYFHVNAKYKIKFYKGIVNNKFYYFATFVDNKNIEISDFPANMHKYIIFGKKFKYDIDAYKIDTLSDFITLIGIIKVFFNY